MEKTTIVFIAQILLAVAAFLIGRYVLPEHKSTIQNAVTQFEVIFKYAESFCAYARQFLTNLSGSEKMDNVVESLSTICGDLNIEVDYETLRAIAQKAYDAMIAGENSTKVIIGNAIEEPKTPDPEIEEATQNMGGLTD